MAPRFSTAALAAALLPLVSAQTFSSCNPMEKACPNNPAIAQDFQSDFRTGQGAFAGWTATAGQPAFQGDGAHFTIAAQGQSTTIQTNGYFMYGRAEVRTKAAPGTGIVSSIVLQSESLDEFDWEFLGSSPNEVQVNYFGKGNTTTFDRMTRHPVADAQANVHTYIVDWNQDRTEFWIDSTRVRVLNRMDAAGGRNYPQTPMNLRIGIWAGGDPNNGQGTIEWAGGLTDFGAAPFTQVLESIKVTNFSPGSEYKWNGNSGNSDSIEVIGGNTPQSPAGGNPPSEDRSSSAPGASSTPTPASTLASSVRPSGTETPTAAAPGNADSPGGLGGGNGGVTDAADLAPEATAVVDCAKNPTDGLCATASLVTPTPAPSGDFSNNNGNSNNNNGPQSTDTFTGAAPKATGFGVALAAGVLGALLV